MGEKSGNMATRHGYTQAMRPQWGNPLRRAQVGGSFGNGRILSSTALGQDFRGQLPRDVADPREITGRRSSIDLDRVDQLYAYIL